MHSDGTQTTTRNRGDMCPGTLRLFTASDGMIGRVRSPGGYIQPHQWTALGAMADDLGDGDVHITSRGNIQIRGVESVDDFASAVTQAGLLPYPRHDRMRNYLASPLSGRSGSVGDVRSLVRAVDRELIQYDDTADLPGRTLFAFDDGRGDVIAERPDFGVIATTKTRPSDAHDFFDVVIGGDYLVGSLPRARVVDSVVELARQWQARRGKNWRIEETPGAAEDLARWTRENLVGLEDPVHDVLPVYEESADNELGLRQPMGWIDQDDGRVSLACVLPFGRMDSACARLLGAVGKPSTVTCWHGVVVHDLTPAEADEAVRFLAPRGLIFDAASPLARVTACTGLPQCRKSRDDVRSDAVRAINAGSLPGGRVHFVGCERRCGAPNMDYTEFLAEGDGVYETSEVTHHA